MAIGPGHESRPEQLRGRVQMEAGLDAHGFLSYLEANITPQMLLADRHGQARLDWLLERRYYRGSRKLVATPVSGERIEYDQETDLDMFPNPVPVVQLRHSDRSGRWRSSTYARASFLLSEPAVDPHIYFFMAGDPAEEVPDYLRPEDVVPSGFFVPVFQKQISPPEMPGETHFDTGTLRARPYYGFVRLPFKKPLERVPVGGGMAERFNYVTDTWEVSNGFYSPETPTAALHVADLLGLNRPAFPN